MVCLHWGCGTEFKSENHRIECTFHPGRYEFGSANVEYIESYIYRVCGRKGGHAVEGIGEHLDVRLAHIEEWQRIPKCFIVSIMEI